MASYQKHYGLFCLVWVFLWLSTFSFSADLYVRPGPSGDGTKASPYNVLWKAMDKALRGDVIHVARGTYSGKGGSGAFIVRIPHLTMVGGYTNDFSSRDPFVHMTILKRSKDYKGDNTGLPNGIISGTEDHSNFILDGFVLEGRTRNVYRSNGDIGDNGSFSGELLGMSSLNIKVRNCILLNPFGVGIYCMWQGEENEVTNTFVLNTFYTGISTRSAQSGSIIRIKNCTIGFVWFQAHKGGGTSVFVGSQGQTILENNVFMFNQEFAVHNGFGNEDTIMKNNLFFQCQGGYYKYMDEDGKNLLVWKQEDLDDLNDDPEFFMLLEAEGNSDGVPSLKPDVDYFKKFSNYVSAEPGKLNMDELNKWRQSLGLPLQGEGGAGPGNYGHAYPLDKVVPNLIASSGKAGVRQGGFLSYASKNIAEEDYDFKETDFDAFKREVDGVKKIKAAPVMFKAGLGPDKQRWFETIAEKASYRCVMLLRPGEEDEYTRNFILGYILKGSEAEKAWDKYYKKKKNYNEDGIVIKGLAYYLDDSYTYPVALVVKEITRK